ncbi:hypothetical protein [Psychrobacter sp. W2-37-MNA-CIBAN-0211]|uniref:hypothetical protein n=1 Tax=Psychrobacter sp. W2-37-MNA-CIBAN-0211 TaxID=3140443 RepID=UPI0033258683
MNTATTFFNRPPKNPFYFITLFMVQMVAIIIHSRLDDYFKYADNIFIVIAIIIAGLMIINAIRATAQNRRQAKYQ